MAFMSQRQIPYKSSTTENGHRERSFNIPISSSGRNISLKISEPDIRADNLVFETWASSFIMAGQLHRLSIPTPSTYQNSLSVLELGAGTGLVGLTAATLWHTEAVLTDLSPNVSGMATNIALNRSLVAEYGGSARCGTLDWRNPSELLLVSGENDESEQRSNRHKANVILAADVIYDEDHPELLFNVVTTWLRRDQDARFIITWPLRVAYLDQIREIWERLEAAGLEAIQELRETANGAQWDDELQCECVVWKWRETTS
ncbi:hypothetical protein H2203_007709 [Taxawa tesnikishii (nom. ined.)]|nr:hypothetical protein H2203_007709 [Dothideales sp. JES 119]